MVFSGYWPAYSGGFGGIKLKPPAKEMFTLSNRMFFNRYATPFVKQPEMGQPRVSVRLEPVMFRKVIPLTLPGATPMSRLPKTMKMAFWQPEKLIL